MTFIAAVFVLAAAPLFSGCADKPTWKEPGPRQTFEAFLMHIFRGESQLAFEAVAPEDRDVLTAALDELKDVPEEARPEPHQMWVITAVDNPFDVKLVEPVEELEHEPETGHRLKLRISYHDGREGSATMIWGGERWFVDLPLEQTEGAPVAPAVPAEEGT